MNNHNTTPAILIALTLFGFSAATLAATSRGPNLTGWVDHELVPYVTDQLTEHPRFKGETVVFVALYNGAPAPVTNALVLALRDRLIDALIDEPGIAIGRQAGHGGKTRSGTSDCGRNAVHYFIGLEATELINGRHRVSMRVLDVEDQSWVTGSGRTWEGRLTTAQRRAFERALTDEYFRGRRDAPFTTSQTDMLAASLARDLTCALLRQVAGEYVIATDSVPVGPAPLAGTVELVGNNLAGNRALQITAHAADSNAILKGKAHRINDDLYQYWVIVTPTNNSTSLQAVSASAYVHVPTGPGTQITANNVDRTSPQSPPANALPTMHVQATDAALLAPIRVVEPRERRSCYRAGTSRRRQKMVTADHTVKRGECFALQTRVDHAASVFLLNYQVNDGLVRLADAGCRQETTSFSARRGERLQFPTYDDPRPSASAWQGQEGLESFYAVAVSDREAEWELAALIDRLPSRCTLSPSDGLVGTELQTWLADFGVIVARWQDDIDWQAVRIQHVY